jgi:hypothetical protein
MNIMSTTSPLRDEILPLKSGTHALQVLTSESDGEAPSKGKGPQHTANFAVLQETSHLGRTSPMVMATENLPQEVRMPLMEDLSARIRTVWDAKATGLTPPTQSTKIGTNVQKFPPAPTVSRSSKDHHSLPTSGLTRDGPSSSGSNTQPPEDHKLSAMHMLLTVCQ